VWPNGDSYDGNFKFGKRNGQGKRTNIDGSEYNGEYVDDKPQGRGNNINEFLTKINRTIYLERWREIRGRMERWQVSW